MRSDLSPGVSGSPTSPQATDAALYSMRSGTIPGIAGHPTNRGADPYVATRGANGWSTRYVGLPSNNPFATGPFASPLSGSDSALEHLLLRRSGNLRTVLRRRLDQRAAASLRRRSRPGHGRLDGSRPGGTGGNGRKAALGRRLPLPLRHHRLSSSQPPTPTAPTRRSTRETSKRGRTEVVSTDDTGIAIVNGEDVAELDVSKDGTRTVIGEKLSTDSAGNDYFHLYLHIAGTAGSVDLMPGATARRPV